MTAHDHDHAHGHHESDLKPALMGFFGALLFIAVVVVSISRWTSSLFAGHAG